MKGISICILTYNVYFYNRLAIERIRETIHVTDYEILVYDNGSTDGSVEWLAEQPEVTLYCGKDNSMRHGQALDFLVQRANYPICGFLCSDAFPMSREWLVPALYLSSETYLAGIERAGSREKLCRYPCPSYMFGWTEWLKRHSFVDNWPEWDTGEKLAQECLDEGHEIRTWKSKPSSWAQYSPKQSDYNGWVYHTWWSGRAQTVPGVLGGEVEEGYHDHVKEYFRKLFNLDY